MFIRTNRLFLRPAWPEDWQELHAAIADERIVRNFAHLPWPFTPEDARAQVARPQDLRHPGFLITLPSARGSRLIGGAGLHPRQGSELAQADFGFWIAADSWGCGYATEAVSAVLRLGRTLGHKRIAATPFLDDLASARVLEKVGFKGGDRIVERYSRARGGVCSAREYGIEFHSASDCDDGIPAGDEASTDMRAA